MSMRNGLWLMVAMVMFAASVASGQDRVRAWRVRLEGDLDAMRLVQLLQVQFTEAARDRAGVILLEVEGRKSRQDVVWRLAQTVRTSSVPVVSYVGRGEHGAGHVAIAMLAKRVYVHPDAAVVWESSDDCREFAPADTDWEQVCRQLSGALFQAIKDRGGEPRLAEVMVGPTPDTWIVSDTEDRLSVTFSQPHREGDKSEQVAFGGMAAAAKLHIPAKFVAKGFGIETSATSAGVMRAENMTVVSRQPRVIASELHDAASGARSVILGFDARMKSAEESLKAANAAGAKPAGQGRAEQARAVERAMRLVTIQEEELRSAESRLREYPEVLRMIPPDKTSIMEDSASKRRTAWESAFNRAWTRVRGVRTAAEGYAR